MNPLTPPDISLDLDTVYQHFKAWRAERKHNEAIPEALWQQVFQLLEHYPRTQVLRTLGLKSTRLTQKLTPAGPVTSTPDFVAIPLTGLSVQAEAACRVELALAPGRLLTLQVPWPQLVPFVRHLLGLA